MPDPAFSLEKKVAMIVGAANGIGRATALTFAAAGLLLWSACFGAVDVRSSARRATAIGALLLTTMHMTLLGTLLALAPRTLYGTHEHAPLIFALAPLQDQQLAGVVRLTVGGASYLAGGVWLLAGLLRGSEHEAARPWW